MGVSLLALLLALVCHGGLAATFDNAESTTTASEQASITAAAAATALIGRVVAGRFRLMQHLPKARDSRPVATADAADADADAFVEVEGPDFVHAFTTSDKQGALKRLGGGGFGTVYKAVEHSGATVAIKLIGTSYFPPHVAASGVAESDRQQNNQQAIQERDSNTPHQIESLHTELKTFSLLKKAEGTLVNIVEFDGAVVARDDQSFWPEDYIAYDVKDLSHAEFGSTPDGKCVNTHDGVVKLIDTSCLRGVWMEFCEFGDLHTAMESKAYAPEVLLRLLHDGLAGVRVLHKHGLTHNDVKPGNLLLCAHENKLTAKLADFGTVSDDTHRAPSKDSAPLPGQLVTGTTAYHAPEGINAAPVTGLIDVFSLGQIGTEIFGNPVQIKLSRDQGNSWTRMMHPYLALAKNDPWSKVHAQYTSMADKNLKDCKATRAQHIEASLTTVTEPWKAELLSLLTAMQACDVWAEPRSRLTSQEALEKLTSILTTYHFPPSPPAAVSRASVDAPLHNPQSPPKAQRIPTAPLSPMKDEAAVASSAAGSARTLSPAAGSARTLSPAGDRRNNRPTLPSPPTLRSPNAPSAARAVRPSAPEATLQQGLVAPPPKTIGGRGNVRATTPQRRPARPRSDGDTLVR